MRKIKAEPSRVTVSLPFGLRHIETLTPIVTVKYRRPVEGWFPTLLAVYLDLAATILPTIALWLLIRRNTSTIWINAGSIARVESYFLSAVGFDILRNLGFGWAVYGILVSLWLIFNSIGLLAATVYYCPESRSFRESAVKANRHVSVLLYELTLTVWLIVNIAIPDWYLVSTLILLATVIVYPTKLFSLAKGKTQSSRAKDILSVLAFSWFLFVTLALFLFALGTDPPVLGISIPFAWQIAFITVSPLFPFMSKAVTDPGSLSKPWMRQLVSEPILKSGRRYLIVHDAGDQALSFLVSSLRSLIGTGARIVLKPSGSDSFLGVLAKKDSRLNGWAKEGKLAFNSSEADNGKGSWEEISEKFGLGSSPTVYVTELERAALQEIRDASQSTDRDTQMTELFLLESSQAPRSLLAEFLRKNGDMQLMDFSEPKAPFSSLLNLEHLRLQGSTILLEYDSNAGYEDVVDKFLSEGTENAEVSVFFTSKSSKLYRAIKGKRMVKVVTASSLVSVPEELSDGEVEIPDRELGLVTSIVSDFLENNKTMMLSFAFDSLSELIGGERWEQIYSGVKQLVEMLSVPNATTLFLVNRDVTEPRFLGALKSSFPVQLKLDAAGLQATKLPLP